MQSKGLGLQDYTWPAFVAEATAVFVAKDADYERRFMRGLAHYHAADGMPAARTIWAWEVEKKLDRCRTWIKRGELQVKGENVRDSVIDLFVYTVQFAVFKRRIAGGFNPLDVLTPKGFERIANQGQDFERIAKQGPDYWLGFIRAEGLISAEEVELQSLLLEQMTGLPF